MRSWVAETSARTGEGECVSSWRCTFESKSQLTLAAAWLFTVAKHRVPGVNHRFATGSLPCAAMGSSGSLCLLCFNVCTVQPHINVRFPATTHLSGHSWYQDSACSPSCSAISVDTAPNWPPPGCGDTIQAQDEQNCASASSLFDTTLGVLSPHLKAKMKVVGRFRRFGSTWRFVTAGWRAAEAGRRAVGSGVWSRGRPSLWLPGTARRPADPNAGRRGTRRYRMRTSRQPPLLCCPPAARHRHHHRFPPPPRRCCCLAWTRTALREGVHATYPWRMTGPRRPHLATLLLRPTACGERWSQRAIPVLHTHLQVLNAAAAHFN